MCLYLLLISNVIVGLNVYTYYDITWILFITCFHCNTWRNTTMRKKGVLQLALQLNFRVASNTCNSPYLYIVTDTGWYWSSCKSWNSSCATHYNFVATTHFQLLCNSPTITIIMSCWRHFFIHPSKFNTCHYEKKRDFFEILISIVQYDYSF
jgi:hypothetical protein